MNEPAASALKAWESFYVIVGSSAGALTGLQFVVLTLIADSGTAGRRGEAIAAFGSPNVVHFCAALLVSAIFSAPWGGLAPPGAAIATVGALGVLYAFAVMRRALRQRDYQPVAEDWIWHAVLPTIAYAALLHAGFVLAHASADTLYVVGAATLLLVFVGIHNAWDTVTYVTVERAPGGSLARPSGAHASQPPTRVAEPPDPRRS